jgi:hypothetical protein
MPFKSQAQRRKFAELLVKGEISPETYEEWNRETGGAKLPERVDRKRKPKAKTRGRAKTATTAAKRRAKPRAKRKTGPRRKAK